jgi:hypothetical protein
MHPILLRESKPRENNRDLWKNGIRAKFHHPWAPGPLSDVGSNITTVDWPACGEIDIMEHVGFMPTLFI